MAEPGQAVAVRTRVVTETDGLARQVAGNGGRPRIASTATERKESTDQTKSARPAGFAHRTTTKSVGAGHTTHQLPRRQSFLLAPDN